MSEAMEKLIEKISSYELLNNLIPGAVYIGVVERVTSFKLGAANVYTELALFYFVGVVIGRIGSLCLEGFLYGKKEDGSTDVATIPHSDFTKAELMDRDRKITTLSAINNMYRTFISVSVCCLLTVILDSVWCYVPKYFIFEKGTLLIVIGCVGLTVLFVKAHKKQTGYVVSRAKTILASDVYQKEVDNEENASLK